MTFTNHPAWRQDRNAEVTKNSSCMFPAYPLQMIFGFPAFGVMHACVVDIHRTKTCHSAARTLTLCNANYDHELGNEAMPMKHPPRRSSLPRT
jgi:hypothetical protein